MYELINWVMDVKEFLKGKKTYITGFLSGLVSFIGVCIATAHGLEFIDDATYQSAWDILTSVVATLVSIGLITLRAGMSKEEIK